MPTSLVRRLICLLTRAAARAVAGQVRDDGFRQPGAARHRLEELRHLARVQAPADPPTLAYGTGKGAGRDLRVLKPVPDEGYGVGREVGAVALALGIVLGGAHEHGRPAVGLHGEVVDGQGVRSGAAWRRRRVR